MVHMREKRLHCPTVSHRCQLGDIDAFTKLLGRKERLHSTLKREPSYGKDHDEVYTIGYAEKNRNNDSFYGNIRAKYN